MRQELCLQINIMTGKIWQILWLLNIQHWYRDYMHNLVRNTAISISLNWSPQNSAFDPTSWRWLWKWCKDFTPIPSSKIHTHDILIEVFAKFSPLEDGITMHCSENENWCQFRWSLFQRVQLNSGSGNESGLKRVPLIDLTHKSHNAPVPYLIIQYFITEMCTCVHISVTKLCSVGHHLSHAL